VSTREDRALARAAVAGCALALAALFWPALQRRVFVYSDLGHFSLPIRMFLARNLEQGITPLWMPDLFCGYYAHGDGQNGIFHPVRWLLYRSLPLSEAFNLECLIPFPLALAGIALFLRRLALPASAAMLGGLTFAFSPYLTLRLAHLNAIEVLAHLGWVLLAIDALQSGDPRARVRGVIGAAVATGSMFLIGYPAAIASVWGLAVAYALGTAIARRRVGSLAAVAGALALGVLLGAIQWLPTWDQISLSQRADPSYEYLTHLSLHPLNLLSALAPWLFRGHIYSDPWYDPVEEVFYFGPVVPIAAAWLIVRWRQLGALRPLLAALGAISAVALLLALGKYTPVYRYFVALPLVDLLRVPARYTIALYLAGAIVAAVAFADLLHSDRPEAPRRAGRIWLVPIASALLALAALALRARLPRAIADQLAGPGWIALGPLGFALAAGLWTAAARGARAAAVGLVALALADHAGYAASVWWSETPRAIADYRAGIALPPVPAPLRVATPGYFDMPWRKGDRVLYWSSTALIANGAQLVSGYAPIVPATRLDYAKAASLRVAGAGALQAEDRAISLPGALPRVRLVASAQASDDPRRDIEKIDVAETALVEAPLALGAGPPGSARSEREVPDSIEVAAQAPARQLLVLAESYHEGWRATVDGRDAPVLRVNGDFMGVALDAGAHRVAFSFAPRSFAVGRAISLAGLAVVLALALYATALSGWRSAFRAITAGTAP
jgi:hypothetical protein